MSATVYDTDGGEAGEVDLPTVFETPYRPDLIGKAVRLRGAYRLPDQLGSVRRLEYRGEIDLARLAAVGVVYLCCHPCPWFDAVETYRTSGSRRGWSPGLIAGRNRSSRWSGPGSDPFTSAYGPSISP